MNTNSLKLAGVAVVLAASTSAAIAHSSLQAIYVVSGTIVSSTASGGATCAGASSSVKGQAYFPGFKHAGFTIALPQSTDSNAVVYWFPKIKSFSVSGNFQYDLPPAVDPLDGKFAFSSATMNGKSTSFTLEAKTGSLGSGAGACDTFYNLTLTKGIPKWLKSLL